MQLSIKTTRNEKKNSVCLDSLLSCRFFAITHIYFYHLWLNHQASPKTFLPDAALLPNWLINIISHGWMSTSFFFVLSGFTIHTLYTDKSGSFRIKKTEFWFRRIIRIYPIHLVLLGYAIYMNYGWFISQDNSPTTLVNSAIANAFLIQAWVPEWLSFWNWPTWAISVLMFLYLTTPCFSQQIKHLSAVRLVQLLYLAPFLSLAPTALLAYWANFQNLPITHIVGGYSAIPLVWIPCYLSGMLLSRLIVINTHKQTSQPQKQLIALGDMALILLVCIALIPDIQDDWKFFLRQGGLIPLFIILIFDFSRNNGILPNILQARLLTNLGNISFSIFMWQGTIITLMWYGITNKSFSHVSQWIFTTIGMLAFATASYIFFERPISRYFRKRQQPK